MNLMAFVLAMTAAFFWGLAQAIGKLCVQNLNATVFNAIRFSTVALILTPVVFVSGPSIGEAWPIFLAIISGFLGLYFATDIYFYILKRAPAHRIIPIGNSAPIWAVLIAIFILGEKVSAILPFSLALVVGGTILFVPQKRERGMVRFAVPLTLAVAFIWGLNQVIRKSAIGAGIEILTFLWISVAFAAVLLILTAGVMSSWKGLNFSRRSIGLSMFSGIAGHLVGNFCYLTALQMEQVSTLAPFISATIPFGFLLSVLIVGEKPNIKAVIGMVVIFLGVAIAAI